MTPGEIKRKLDNSLPGISTPLMRSDNLAIVLCSAFDDYNTETEDDSGWSQAARDGYEEVIAAIKAHYQPLETENARLRTALADAEAKLVSARDDALEEAAKVTAMVPSSMIGSSETYPKAYKDACYHAAAAIRSLKSLTDT